MSCGNEIAQDGLLHQRGVAASDGERGGNAIGEICRHDEVAEAKRGEENFAEAAGEEDEAVAIEALQRWDWSSGVTEFAIVVVFQNLRAGFAGGFEELQTAREAHGDSEGKLMARSNV